MKLNTLGGDWAIVRRYARAEIEASRDRLESLLSNELTLIERGRIDALRRLLDEFEPNKTPVIEDENYG